MKTATRINQLFDTVPARMRTMLAFIGPSAGKSWKQYYVGTEKPYECGYNAPGDPKLVCVFEFPTDELQDEFLDVIGGAPHPLGGRRVILGR